MSPFDSLRSQPPTKTTSLKAVFDREKLLDAFQTASAVAPGRSAKWALRSIKLEALHLGATQGTVMATDLNVDIRVNVPGLQVESPGSVILPIARCASILHELPDAQVRLEANDQGAIVRGDRSEFRLPAENPDEYPAIAPFTESKYHELPSHLLREIIRRTVFATGMETDRYALGGVLVELTADKITAVGTDGHRLAIMEATTKAVGDHQSGVKTAIISARALHLIERLLGDEEGEVQLATRANDVLVKTVRGSIRARLLDGRFPKWRDLITERREVTQIELVAGPTYAAVRQAAVVTNEEHRSVNFTFGDGKLVLAGRSMGIGQSRIELPIRGDHKPITITLDPRYVSDFLKVLAPEKTFALELKDAESAVVCRTDDGYRYIIMPIARDQSR